MHIRTYLCLLVQLGYKSEAHIYKVSIDKLTFLNGQLILGNKQSEGHVFDSVGVTLGSLVIRYCPSIVCDCHGDLPSWS